MNIGFAPVALLVAFELWRARDAEATRTVRFALAAAGGLAILVPLFVWLAANGALDEARVQVWQYARRASAGDYVNLPERPFSVRDLLDVNAGTLWILGLAGCAIAFGNRRLRPLAISAALWIVVMWLRVKVNRGPEYAHHFYLGLPGIAAGIAVGVRAVADGVPLRRFALIAALVLVAPVWKYGVAPQWNAFHKPVAERQARFHKAYEIADFVNAHTPRDSTIFVQGSEAEVYWIADRKAPTKYFADYVLWTHRLQLVRERRAELRANPPAAIATIDPEQIYYIGLDDVSKLVEERGYELKYVRDGVSIWLHPRYAGGVRPVLEPAA
jgi:hypothetical protein